RIVGVAEGTRRPEPVRGPRRGRHRRDPGAYHGGAKRRGRRAAPERRPRRADGARRSHRGDVRRPAGVRDGARGRRSARHRPLHGESPMTTATTVIRGGTLLEPAGLRARPADILIEGDTIREIGAPGLRAPEGTRQIDARDRLLIPGLINAHTHSHGALARGIVPDAIRPRVEGRRAAPGQASATTCRDILKAWPIDRSEVAPGIGPTIPLHCSDGFLGACRDLAREFDVPLQMHLAESRGQAVLGIEKYGTSLTAHLDALGVVGPRFSGAHGVWLEDDDVRRLAGAGASIAHNPMSNLRLGSG